MLGLQMTMNKITENMNLLIDLSDWGNRADFIYHFLTMDPESPGKKTVKLKAYQSLKEEYDTNKANDYLFRFMIGNQDGSFIQEVKFVTDSSSKDYERTIQSEYFSSLLFAPSFTWIGFVTDPLTPYTKRQIIPIIRPVYNRYHSSIVGWTYLTISSTLISDALKEYPIMEDSQLYLTFGQKTYLYQDQTFIELSSSISFQNGKEILSNLYDDNSNLSAKPLLHTMKNQDGKEITLISYPSTMEGWYLSQSISNKELASQKRTYYMILFFILLLGLFFGILLIVLLNQMFNQPVARLRKKMSEISEGDFSYDASIEWENEFGEIGKGINSLSKNIVNLMETRIAAENQQKELEYQILQSQVNPHFLYNTLNSIKWMATIQNATGIAEMTTALSRLLKSISKGTRQEIPIQEELALLKNYVLIQQYRYGGIITVSYQIEEDTLDYQIPKFTLQPLVENAMFHGIEAKGSTGEIKISIEKNTFQNQPGICITITDNGIGMSKELIKQVLAGEAEDTQHDFFRKIGIYNVNKRIQFCFGKEYGISITSQVGLFTTMKIQLPCQKAGRKEENLL